MLLIRRARASDVAVALHVAASLAPRDEMPVGWPSNRSRSSSARPGTSGRGGGQSSGACRPPAPPGGTALTLRDGRDEKGALAVPSAVVPAKSEDGRRLFQGQWRCPLLTHFAFSVFLSKLPSGLKSCAARSLCLWEKRSRAIKTLHIAHFPSSITLFLVSLPVASVRPSLPTLILPDPVSSLCQFFTILASIRVSAVI